MHEEVSYSRSAAVPGLVLSTARFSAFRFAPHYHLDCHIALVTEGVQRQSYRGEALLLSRGSIQLMPAGEVHDGISGADAAYTLQTFRLSPELLKGLGEEITGRHHFPSQAGTVLRDSQLAEQLLGMHTALQNQAVADTLWRDGHTLELLESLFARLLKPPPQAVSGTLTRQQLVRVRDYMEAHLCEKLLLQDLALLVGLDRFRFLKLFKRTVGMTPHAWLLRLRLERAVALLKAGRDVSITEVAHTVGFFDQSHFTHAFQAAYGVTPARFQQPGVNFLQGKPSSPR